MFLRVLCFEDASISWFITHYTSISWFITDYTSVQVVIKICYSNTIKYKTNQFRFSIYPNYNPLRSDSFIKDIRNAIPRRCICIRYFQICSKYMLSVFRLNGSIITPPLYRFQHFFTEFLLTNHILC